MDGHHRTGMGVPTLEHPQLCSKPCCAPETDRRLLPSPPTSPTGGGGAIDTKTSAVCF